MIRCSEFQTGVHFIFDDKKVDSKIDYAEIIHNMIVDNGEISTIIDPNAAPDSKTRSTHSDLTGEEALNKLSIAKFPRISLKTGARKNIIAWTYLRG